MSSRAKTLSPKKSPPKHNGDRDRERDRDRTDVVTPTASEILRNQLVMSRSPPPVGPEKNARQRVGVGVGVGARVHRTKKIRSAELQFREYVQRGALAGRLSCLRSS